MTPKQLKSARSKLGYSQRKMAEELGYSKSMYHFMESGERKIRPSVPFQIKQMLEEIK